jgi:hypothetical protein
MRAEIFNSRPISGAVAAGVVCVILTIGAGLGGCVLKPQGTTEEQTRLGLASPPFEPLIETRQPGQQRLGR